MLHRLFMKKYLRTIDLHASPRVSEFLKKLGLELHPKYLPFSFSSAFLRASCSISFPFLRFVFVLFLFLFLFFCFCFCFVLQENEVLQVLGEATALEAVREGVGRDGDNFRRGFSTQRRGGGVRALSERRFRFHLAIIHSSKASAQLHRCFQGSSRKTLRRHSVLFCPRRCPIRNCLCLSAHSSTASGPLRACPLAILYPSLLSGDLSWCSPRCAAFWSPWSMCDGSIWESQALCDVTREPPWDSFLILHFFCVVQKDSFQIRIHSHCLPGTKKGWKNTKTVPCSFFFILFHSFSCFREALGIESRGDYILFWSPTSPPFYNLSKFGLMSINKSKK